jgi:hypothetical protein
MRLIFKDGQTLNIQSINVQDGTMHVNVINNVQEQLKHLFTDPQTTGSISVEDDAGKEAEVYENYTEFQYIQENAGGIFIVEMQKSGESTREILNKLQEENEELKTQNEMLMQCVLEMSELVYQ